MSNLDSMTKEETLTAAAQGWKVCEVWDLEKQRLLREITPKHAVHFVVAQARSGNALAIKALRMLHGQNT